MNRAATSVMVAFLLTVTVALSCAPSPRVSVRAPSQPAKRKRIDTGPMVFPVSTDLVAVLNETRKAAGLGPVIESFELNEAARIQAEHQAATDTISHTGPPGLAMTADRLRRAGIFGRCIWWGEICAMGQKAYWPDGSLAIDYDFRTANRDWLTSPGHKAILLHGMATHAGAFMVTNAVGRTYSTAVFARLQPQVTHARILTWQRQSDLVVRASGGTRNAPNGDRAGQ